VHGGDRRLRRGPRHARCWCRIPWSPW
jgi:hypothetical protein